LSVTDISVTGSELIGNNGGATDLFMYSRPFVNYFVLVFHSQGESLHTLTMIISNTFPNILSLDGTPEERWTRAKKHGPSPR